MDLAIGGLALLLACLIGIPLGALAAWRGGWLRSAWRRGVSLLGISMPVYVAGAAAHPAVRGDAAVAAGRRLGRRCAALPRAAGDGDGAALHRLRHAHHARGRSIDTLQQPYIRTARAKGLATRPILFRHALRPALVPLVAFLGPAVVGAITGSIVIETTFGLPGIGQFFVRGAFNRDYTLVMGVTVLYGVLIVAGEPAGRPACRRCSIRA